ncbi:MAG: type IX secretion system membrane protein PorP/SprF [Cyclobacteriaceae bacterium]|nr:type IX secretion system membrane protein PorP/SprF [Cyclobacteriaceae bacterium HetDA_MAG_MS6]
MKNYWVFWVFVLGIVRTAGAQDAQYSQYYANPLYLNPAFAGATPAYRVVLNYRVQWPNLPRAFANYSASFDANIPHLNSGFGMIMHADRAGTAGLQATTFAFNYSYNVSINNKWIFKPGLSFGVTSQTIDLSKLLFGDQIDFGSPGAPSLDPAAGDINGSNYIDLGTGALLYNRNLWVGVSFFHLNEPNASILRSTNKIPMSMSVHGGARIPLGDKRFRGDRYASAAPSFIYKRQGTFQQLDLGISFNSNPVTIGLYYRGIPFLETLPDQSSRDAIIALFGVELLNFEFGYSYDINISKLGPDTGGSHEFSLQYVFDIQRNKKRVTRKQKILHCPAFVKKLSH